MARLRPMNQQAGYLTLLFKAAFAAALIVSAMIAIIYSMVFPVATYMIYARSRPAHIREQNRLGIKRLWQRKTILGACDSWYNWLWSPHDLDRQPASHKSGLIHPE